MTEYEMQSKAYKDSKNKLGSCNIRMESQKQKINEDIVGIYREYAEMIRDVKDSWGKERRCIGCENGWSRVGANQEKICANQKKISKKVKKIAMVMKEFSSKIDDTSEQGELLKVMNGIDNKIFRVIQSLQNINDIIKSPSSSESFQPKFQFGSPVLMRSNGNLPESFKKISSNSAKKPPTHFRAQTLSAQQPSPFAFQFPDVSLPERHSLIEESSIKSKDLHSDSKHSEKFFKKSESDSIIELKLRISKAKNQRDKARIDADKILVDLKEAKFSLAAEKEKISEKSFELQKKLKQLANLFVSSELPNKLIQEFQVHLKSISILFI